MSLLLFQSRIPANREAFALKVINISAKLNIDPDWLMAVMYSESKLSHTIQNTDFPFANGYATGLIQFTPDTAIGLGTTVAKLRNMTSIQQLDYVYKYYATYTGKIKSYIDLYLVTFFPVALGKPDSFILEAKGISRIAVAKSNPIFDLNKDLMITVGEVKKAFLKRLSEMQGGMEAVLAFTRQNKVTVGITVAILLLSLYGLLKMKGNTRIV